MKLFTTTILLVTMIFLANAQEKKINKSFSGVSEITLNTGSGDLTLEKGSGNSVNVTVTHTYDEDDYEAKMRMSGSKLIMEEKFHASSMRGSSHWVIQMPDNIEFDFNTGSGDLEISDITIEMDGNSGSGDIDLTDVNGEFDMNTGSGDYVISNLSGEFKVNTGSGDIKLEESEGEFRGNTGSGDIKLSTVSGSCNMNTGSGDVRVEGLRIKEASKFNSGSGDVSVELGGELNDDISVNSGSGDAVLDFNGNEIEGSITMKAKKNSGEIIAPFKFDKVEDIEEGNQTYVKKTVKLGNKDIEIYVGTGTGDAVIKE
ncbi:DUF4097 domain-containing protein [Bacteroidota bacterium]